MKVNFLGKVPDGYSPYGELQEFDKYDIKYLNDLGLDEIWYWYVTAPYEGSGQILMRRGDLYDIHDAGHCSCYGATDNIKFNGKLINELAKSLSNEYMKCQAKELFENAGYNLPQNHD